MKIIDIFSFIDIIFMKNVQLIFFKKLFLIPINLSIKFLYAFVDIIILL